MDAQSFIEKGISEGYIHETAGMETLVIEGHRDDYRVYEIRLDKLKYNVRNGRIATYISRYKQDHDDFPDEGSEEFNSLIAKFIEDDNPKALNKTKLDIREKGQQRPAVVLSDGTVIDGNRRFTCLRKLQEEEGGQPRYLRCFVLDSALDSYSLKGLELELQFGQDEKVSYDPVSRLVDIYTWCVAGDYDSETYRKRCGMKPKEMEDYLAQVDLMCQFLEFINADEQFHIVQDLKLQGQLQELHATLKKCHDDEKAEDIKMAAFSYFLIGDGDSARRVREMGKIALSTEGDDFLEEQLEIAQDVLEKFDGLSTGETVSVDFVRDKIRADRNLVGKQGASVERHRRLMNNENVKEAQVKSIAKALIELERIEFELISKLSNSSLSKMSNDLGRIINLADDLSEAVAAEQKGRE